MHCMDLGHADSVAEALQMAEDIVGPNTTYTHIPPLFMCEATWRPPKDLPHDVTSFTSAQDLDVANSDLRPGVCYTRLREFRETYLE